MLWGDTLSVASVFGLALIVLSGIVALRGAAAKPIPLDTSWPRHHRQVLPTAPDVSWERGCNESSTGPAQTSMAPAGQPS